MLTKRDIATLLEIANSLANEVAFELDANGEDEIRGNPILRAKQQLLRRAQKSLTRLKAKSEADASPVNSLNVKEK
jgi:hypothetical protein